MSEIFQASASEEGNHEKRIRDLGTPTGPSEDSVKFLLAQLDQIDASNVVETAEYMKRLDKAIDSVEQLNQTQLGKLIEFLDGLNAQIGALILESSGDNQALSPLTRELGSKTSIQGVPLHLEDLKVELEGVLSDVLSDLKEGGEVNIDSFQFVELLAQAKVATARMEANTAKRVLPERSEIVDVTILDTLNDSIGSDSRVILIGIDDYQYGSDLEGAVQDTARMKEALSKVYNIPVENFTILTDAEATKENILQTVASVATEASDDSRMLVYYAGHGVKAGKDNQSFIAPQDIAIPGATERGLSIEPEIGFDEAALISGEELFVATQVEDGQQVLVITDMCFGGNFHRGMEQLRVDKGGDLYQISSSDQEAAAEFNEGDRGLAVASNKTEVGGEERGGLFTVYVTDAMKVAGSKIGFAAGISDEITGAQRSVFLGVDSN